MKRISSRAIAALILVVAAACDKAKPHVGSAPIAEGFAALPAESRVVIGINVKRLGESPTIGRLVDWLLAADPVQRVSLETLLTRCRLDPKRDVDTVLLAMGENREQVALVARGNLVETSLLACVRQTMTEKGGRLDAERIADRTVYRAVEANAATSIWLAFGADRALVIATGKDWLAKIADPAAPKLPSRSDTMALVGRIDANASIWGATYLPVESGQRIADATRGAVAKPAVSLTSELEVTGGATLVVRLDLASEADAVALAEFARTQHAWLALGAQKFGLGRIVGKLSIAPEGNVVVFRIQLDPEDIGRLAEALDKLDD